MSLLLLLVVRGAVRLVVVMVVVAVAVVDGNPAINFLQGLWNHISSFFTYIQRASEIIPVTLWGVANFGNLGVYIDVVG